MRLDRICDVICYFYNMFLIIAVTQPQQKYINVYIYQENYNYEGRRIKNRLYQEILILWTPYAQHTLNDIYY